MTNFEDYFLWRYGTAFSCTKAAGSDMYVIIEPGQNNRMYLLHGLLGAGTLAAALTFTVCIKDGESTSRVIQYICTDTDIDDSHERQFFPLAANTADQAQADLPSIHARMIAGTENLVIAIASAANTDDFQLFIRAYVRWKPTVTITPDPAGADADQTLYYDEIYG